MSDEELEKVGLFVESVKQVLEISGGGDPDAELMAATARAMVLAVKGPDSSLDRVGRINSKAGEVENLLKKHLYPEDYKKVNGKGKGNDQN